MRLFDDKWIIVTGGAGFIGSGVVKHLNDQGFNNIVVVDNLGNGHKWRNLLGKKFFEILHKDQLFSWLHGKETEIEAFIHLGACSSTVESDANYLLENNYRYTVRLAEYALKYNIRFIYASSAATYGDGSNGFSDAHESLQALQPLNMYGYSKHLFDLWALRQGVLGQITGLKYFNVFGPNEAHKGRMASVIVTMVPQAIEQGVIRLFKSTEPSRFADGDQCRDFIYVKDAVAMTCAFLKKDFYGIYNIGRGMPGTWNQLAKATFSALQLPCRIEYIPTPQDLQGKYQNYTCADMSKYKRTGLQEAKTSLEDAVAEYVDTYLLKDARW